ncbi:MAG: OsmC family protein [Cyclobacteriaceae bacterium]|nr:OsmC family protein [Cyclobacteriaceae bacterium]
MAFNKYPKVTTKFIDTYEYESVNETGNSVRIDMYDPGNKKAQSPTELLLSALAACSAVDMAEILKKRKKTFSSFHIETRGTRREEHPRAFTSITMRFVLVSENVTREELLKNARLIVDKYCSVATTIKGVATIEVEADVNPA